MSGRYNNVLGKQVRVKYKKFFRLSWDDKYTQLCKEQNVEIFTNVTFGLPMPKVNDTQTI